MLDKFLEVAMGHEKVASAQQKLVDAMTELPVEDLVKIASGETKLSYFHDPEGKWLEKFKGTPLMEQAIALEQQDLEMQMARNEKNRERQELWKEEDAQRDELCVRRRMLDLELAKIEAGQPSEEGEAEEAEEAAEGEAEPMEGAAEAAPVPVEAAKVGAAKNEGKPQTLRDVEKATVKGLGEAGGRYGARVGRRKGGERGVGWGALGGAAAGALHGKGGLKGRALSAAKGGLAGAAAGGAVGTVGGHFKGKSRGKAVGEQLGHRVNIRRRQMIRERMAQAAEAKKSEGQKKTSSAEDHVKMAEEWARRMAQVDFEKQAQPPAAAEEQAPLPISMRAGRAVGRTWLGGAAPVVSGLAHSATGATGGAALGQRLGGKRGALIGAGLGAATGYLTGRGMARAGQGFGAGAVERKEKQLASKQASAHLASGQAKIASGLTYDDLTELEKEAFAAAIGQGLRGIAGFARKAVPRLITAGQKGGLQGLQTAAGRVGRQGWQAAKKFTVANPAAALTMAGTGGVLAGRATS